MPTHFPVGKAAVAEEEPGLNIKKWLQSRPPAVSNQGDKQLLSCLPPLPPAIR